MKRLNQRVMVWTLAAFLLTGVRIFPQATTKQAAQPAKTEVSQSDQDLNIRAYLELLRSDVKTRATAIIAEVMQFDGDDAAKFWPIYREYELELSKIGDEKFALIKKYSDNYEKMSEETADQLVQSVFKLDQARQNLKIKYYERIKTTLTAKTAARFVQVQNQILMLIDLQIASALPVIR